MAILLTLKNFYEGTMCDITFARMGQTAIRTTLHILVLYSVITEHKPVFLLEIFLGLLETMRMYHLACSKHEAGAK